MDFDFLKQKRILLVDDEQTKGFATSKQPKRLKKRLI